MGVASDLPLEETQIESMSKRSRGQMMVQSLRATAQESSPQPLPEKDDHSKPGKPGKSDKPGKSGMSGIKSPLKALMESAAAQKMVETEFKSEISEEVAKISSCFKILNNAVTTYHSRRKKHSWESLVASYQTISPGSLSIDDLATILTIWKDAFILRWQANTFDSAHNPRSYELLVEMPSTAGPSVSAQAMEVDEQQLPQISQSALMTHRIDMFK